MVSALGGSPAGDWALYSGFSFATTLAPGTYTLGLHVHNILDEWHVQTVATVVHGAPQIVIDPTSGGRQPFVVTGTAGDPQSSSGPGIDLLEVWADPVGGGASVRIHELTWGLERPEYIGTPFHYSPLPGSAWREVESSAVEIDRGREVLSVAEASGFALDAHDLAVQRQKDARPSTATGRNPVLNQRHEPS